MTKLSHSRRQFIVCNGQDRAKRMSERSMRDII